VLGFTDYVRDLEEDGVTYKAASGYTRTAIRSTADLAVDNLDLESVFADAGITEEDMHKRRLRQLREPGAGRPELRHGWLGDMSASKARARVSRITAAAPNRARYSPIEEPSQRNDLTPLISLVTLFAARAQ
jgi:hypothetical protein